MTLVSRSPQQPGDVVTKEPATEPAAVAAATRRARAAAREWWSQGAFARAAALNAAARGLAEVAGELEDLIVREVGKPRAEARGEVARSRSIVDYYAQVALLRTGDVLPPGGAGLLYTERRPHGVAGLITPWNFPAAIPLWKALPALAAGNAVLLKPATPALACARLLESVLAAALPAGLFQLVPGGRETATALIDAADVVSFTGSTLVGRQVSARASARGIPAQAEMGGQNAAIVLPDAPVEHTAGVLAGAAMGYAGQKCTATRRVIVVGDPAPLTEALLAAVRELKVGDPAELSTVVGPVIGDDAVAGVRAAAAKVHEAGGEVLTGWSVPAEGSFAAPTVVRGVPAEHVVNQEETFGPITSILPAASVEEAVRIANGVSQGLVTSVHGRDLGPLLAVTRELDTGMIKVNAPTTGVDFHAPFGGEKDSSAGPREQGLAAVDFYSSVRTVTFAPPPAA
ncbi:aldehyde dehydrogenase [Amycolatopsis sp. K13G38]|uniref:Aldehyde dehydrogenase n=1 Tax=Amycolatopsis acididurans TaxID=2724524 RepID=A0ABX1JHK3_9PSEU|nr:aldehyde dehydrogenase family protein [Amycolatopsis acididurans]NKQ57712.1 aldehyde dehydrogenase [Amycolatopsis acididurans]